jgi:tRNA threonylcarbamoyl adenosine modification protein YeaZ
VLVLAIESATDAAGVALADAVGTLAQETLGRGRRHAETIAPAIRSCCQIAGVTLSQVEAVVVDVGPGLFTGLRVGVGTAKALAYALGVPLVAVSSLDVLAQAALALAPWPVAEAPEAPEEPEAPETTETAATAATAATAETASRTIYFPSKGTSAYTSSEFKYFASTSPPRGDSGSTWDRTVVAVLDARRGEVVSAEFGVVTEGQAGQPSQAGKPSQVVRIAGECLEAPSVLASRFSNRLQEAVNAGTGGSTWTFVGDGALRYADVLGDIPGGRIGPHWLASPPVAVVAELGVELARLGHFRDPLTLVPRYVRQADALINWTSRPPRPGTDG